MVMHLSLVPCWSQGKTRVITLSRCCCRTVSASCTSVSLPWIVSGAFVCPRSIESQCRRRRIFLHASMLWRNTQNIPKGQWSSKMTRHFHATKPLLRSELTTVSKLLDWYTPYLMARTRMWPDRFLTGTTRKSEAASKSMDALLSCRFRLKGYSMFASTIALVRCALTFCSPRLVNLAPGRSPTHFTTLKYS